MREKFRLDPQVGLRLMPNLQMCQRQGTVRYLMRTNSEGYRTAPVERRRPQGVRRILFYGDSFTEGAGVSDGKRFTDVLQRTLPQTEVVNHGVSATGTDQQLLLHRELPADLEHDLVVIGLFADDVRRNGSKHMVFTNSTGDAAYEKPYFVLEGEKLVLRNVPVPVTPSSVGRSDAVSHERAAVAAVKDAVRSVVRRHAPQLKPLLERVVKPQIAPALQSADDPAWRITVAIVRQWVEESAVPVLVIAIPPYQYVSGTSNSNGYRRRFAELADEVPVRVHDVLPDLRLACEAEGIAALRLPNDAHLTARGHEVIAESLAPVITEMLSSRAPDQESVDR